MGQPGNKEKSNMTMRSNRDKSTEGLTKGLISESLVKSYITGGDSLAAQSQKWMCSSKSAKNIQTVCSLGPKSELRQPDKADPEQVIKIMPGEPDPSATASR